MSRYLRTFLFLTVCLAATFTLTLLFATKSSAETKPTTTNGTTAGKIPKLPVTNNDPVLSNGRVYPFWGPVCQRYTYSVTYSDKANRPPEYMRIIFNGVPTDMEKKIPTASDYKNGVEYVYKFVPNKIGANFYYFEASNSLGKARDSIIDSPDNGPVLFDSALDKNEIAIIDPQTGAKTGTFTTGKEWVDKVALSDDGKYLAAKTTNKIILFNTADMGNPLWTYEARVGGTGDVAGGVAISGDGSTIAAVIDVKVLLFDKSSNQPKWEAKAANNAYDIAVSKDGQYLAVATAGEAEGPNGNMLQLWSKNSNKLLWQYHASGNFHSVSLSDSGDFIAASTGCPDRKAYIFSKTSNVPLVQSQMLTYDSPISRARISANGNVAVFSTDGGPSSSLVATFNQNVSEPLWRFTESTQRASRALSLTPNGKYIAVANMLGDVYLLSQEKTNAPLAAWKLNDTTAAIDITSGGGLIAVGGTGKKVYLLDTKTAQKQEVNFPEFVATLDISANGNLVAVGTGAAPYFFESYITPNYDKVTPCTTIIEPPEANVNQNQIFNKTTNSKNKNEIKWPEMLFSVGFLLSLLALGLYLAIIKLPACQRILVKWPGLLLKRKIISLILLGTTIVFLILTVVAAVMNKPQNSKNTPTEVTNQGEKETRECGNGICEEIVGETKESCPRDCSGGD